MTWRDDLRDASFRGVPFLVGTWTYETGRYAARHVLAVSESQPIIEDLGPREQLHAFECFVVGDDYLIARDDLLAALEEPGPGTLVHPTWGELQVQVDGAVRVRESADEGGVAWFSIPFTLAAPPPVLVRVATPEQLVVLCDLALTVAIDDFALDAAIIGAIAAVQQAVVGVIEDVLAKINRVRAVVQSAVDAVDSITQAIQAVQSAVESLLALPGQFARSLAGLVAAVFNLLDLASPNVRAEAAAAQLVDLHTSMTQQLRSSSATESATGAATVLPVVNAPSEQAAYDAAVAVQRLNDTVVTISAARGSTAIEYTNREQAEAVLRNVLEAVDDLLPRVGDEVYRSLVLVRAAAVRHLNSVSAELPDVVEYVPPTTLPSLVIAHTLYGDARRATEIVQRNVHIRHPGFVAGGVPLKVLVDE